MATGRTDEHCRRQRPCDEAAWRRAAESDADAASARDAYHVLCLLRRCWSSRSPGSASPPGTAAATESGWTEQGVAGLTDSSCPTCAQPTDAYGIIFAVTMQRPETSPLTKSKLGALAALAGTI